MSIEHRNQLSRITHPPHSLMCNFCQLLTFYDCGFPLFWLLCKFSIPLRASFAYYYLLLPKGLKQQQMSVLRLIMKDEWFWFLILLTFWFSKFSYNKHFLVEIRWKGAQRGFQAWFRVSSMIINPPCSGEYNRSLGEPYFKMQSRHA